MDEISAKITDEVINEVINEVGNEIGNEVIKVVIKEVIDEVTVEIMIKNIETDDITGVGFKTNDSCLFTFFNQCQLFVYILKTTRE